MGVPGTSQGASHFMNAFRGSLLHEANDEDPFDALGRGEHVTTEYVDGDIVIVEKAGTIETLLLRVFSFLVSAADLESIAQVSKKWKRLTESQQLYKSVSSLAPDGSVNWVNFKNLGIKMKGTEGSCFKCLERSTGNFLAVKKPRVFPKVHGTKNSVFVSGG
jgi:hypothetical protein